ncbi:MAG: GNAT family N-acetyltransferase [Actinomycetota bacterium]|nr:GNAT family N-acetyltransferase [Actinomycetota bacterium]
MDIRVASHADIPAIVSFTTDTFEWGDYVPDRIEEWIDDPSGVVMLAVEEAEPIALGRALLLSPSEAWMHAARVRSDRRGEGIAGDVGGVLLGWAQERGALVARLLIEDDNESSIRQVRKNGFRRMATVVRASLTIGAETSSPARDGKHRPPPPIEARPGKPLDASVVASEWPSSLCGRALRGLVANGWQFRTLTTSDVAGAALTDGLWELGASWALTRASGTSFEVSLLDTGPSEAFEVICALIDVARERDAQGVSIWLADLAWLTRAAEAAGCTLSPSGVWVYDLSTRSAQPEAPPTGERDHLPRRARA